MAYKIMLRMWWRIRDRNFALFLRWFIIYSCYLARVNNEKYIMNRSQLIAIASNAFYQYTHTNIDNRDRSNRTLTLIFLFFVLAAHFSCVLHFCLAPLCSTTSVPHYLFCQFFIHSRHRRCFLFILFSPILPIVVDLCFWFFLLLCFNNFVENWIIEVNY